jgi:hypothetical protein
LLSNNGIHAGLSFRIVRGQVHKHTDAPHPLGLLRPRRERPSRRAAGQAPRRHVIDCIAAHANPTEMSIFLRRDPVT